jgi:hypothetical protein
MGSCKRRFCRQAGLSSCAQRPALRSVRPPRLAAARRIGCSYSDARPSALPRTSLSTCGSDTARFAVWHGQNNDARWSVRQPCREIETFPTPPPTRTIQNFFRKPAMACRGRVQVR